MKADKEQNKVNYLEVIARLINVVIILLLVIVVLIVLLWNGYPKANTKKENVVVAEKKTQAPRNTDNYWHAPDTSEIAKESNAELIKYGRNLIANTTHYFGPDGIIQRSSNGMNCQNCHLEAGTKVFGNNYSAVASTYPKFRERSGSIETIYKRINDCFERSLNGKAIDSLSKEMQAMVAYIKWLGKDVEKGKKPHGAGLKELAFLNRAADPERGAGLYALKCKSCHEQNGQGKLENGTYKYPPLWGKHSYNQGAGLYRLSRFAAYIKYNMPQGAGIDNVQLSDEEAWDLAAFVNSQPRPGKDLSKDWPKLEGKPVDHPFGPYADNFSEQQHKYGPFEPIAQAKKVKKNK